MPLYEYHCHRCGKDFEIQHKMADPAPCAGPDCPKEDCLIERQISRVAAVVRSPNPFAKAAQSLDQQGMTSSKAETKSEPKGHQCGSGCALHSH